MSSLNGSGSHPLTSGTDSGLGPPVTAGLEVIVIFQESIDLPHVTLLLTSHPAPTLWLPEREFGNRYPDIDPLRSESGCLHTFSFMLHYTVQRPSRVDDTWYNSIGTLDCTLNRVGYTFVCKQCIYLFHDVLYVSSLVIKGLWKRCLWPITKGKGKKRVRLVWRVGGNVYLPRCPDSGPVTLHKSSLQGWRSGPGDLGGFVLGVLKSRRPTNLVRDSGSPLASVLYLPVGQGFERWTSSCNSSPCEHNSRTTFSSVR